MKRLKSRLNQFFFVCRSNEESLPLQETQERRKEQAIALIGRVLQGGVLLSAILILCGVILLPTRPGGLSAQRLLIFPFTWSQLISELVQFHPQSIITLGLLCLIAAPVLRVAVSIVTFVVERDRTYIIITCIVLAILLLSIFGVGTWSGEQHANLAHGIHFNALIPVLIFLASIVAGLLGSLVGLGGGVLIVPLLTIVFKERLCWNKQLRTDLVDEAVWQDVCQLLEDPTRFAQEYREQLQTRDVAPELKGLQASLGRLRQGIARLIDSYAEGVIDKTEFDPRMKRMRERIRQLEEHVQHIKDQEGLEQELQSIIGRVETCATKVNQGLRAADWHTRREIIRTLVKRVEIHQEKVIVIFRISPDTPANPSDTHTQSLQHCRGCDDLTSIGFVAKKS